MSDLYNIMTITAELALIFTVIRQRIIINRLWGKIAMLERKNARLRKNAESDTDTDGFADGSVVRVHNDDSNTE